MGLNGWLFSPSKTSRLLPLKKTHNRHDGQKVVLGIITPWLKSKMMAAKYMFIVMVFQPVAVYLGQTIIFF